MNVLEMHIALRQGVDRVNSLRNDQLRTEEVDLELNRAFLRFINQRYGQVNIHRKGFEESQKRIDDLRVLVTEYTGPAVFKEVVTNNKVWADTFQFPSDYMYLVNQRSTVILNECNPLQFSLSPLPNVYWFSFSPNQFLDLNGQIPTAIRMLGSSGQNVVAWEASQDLLNTGYTGIFPQDINAVLNDMFQHPGMGFSFYWQSYQSINMPGHVVVVVDTQTHPWFNQDGSNGNQITPLVRYSGTTPDTQNQILPKVQDMSMFSTRVPQGPFTLTQSKNRWAQLDDVYTMLEDPFNTTRYDSPLTTVRSNSVDIYTSDIFLIDSVKITYIRKPRPISLPLGYDCELPDHTHEEIVAMAVSAILEGQMDPRYKTQLAEMLSRE